MYSLLSHPCAQEPVFVPFLGTNRAAELPPPPRCVTEFYWTLVPPGIRTMGPSSQLPDDRPGSMSCSVTSRPPVTSHRDEKWKKQHPAAAEGSEREKAAKQPSVLKLLQLPSALPLGRLRVCSAVCWLMLRHVPRSK